MARLRSEQKNYKMSSEHLVTPDSQEAIKTYEVI